MNLTADIIQINEDTRIVVKYDQDAEDPRNWDPGVSVHPIRTNARYHRIDAGTNSHEHQLDEIIEHVPEMQRDDALARHFERAKLPFRIVSMMSGRDWIGDYVWYAEPETVAENMELAPLWNGLDLVDGCIEQYRAYLDGEVYGVILEKRVTWQRADDPDVTQETWEHEDSVWGCYLDGDYTALTVAADHFGIQVPDKE